MALLSQSFHAASKTRLSWDATHADIGHVKPGLTYPLRAKWVKEYNFWMRHYSNRCDPSNFFGCTLDGNESVRKNVETYEDMFRQPREKGQEHVYPSATRVTLDLRSGVNLGKHFPNVTHLTLVESSRSYTFGNPGYPYTWLLTAGKHLQKLTLVMESGTFGVKLAEAIASIKTLTELDVECKYVDFKAVDMVSPILVRIGASVSPTLDEYTTMMSKCPRLARIDKFECEEPDEIAAAVESKLPIASVDVSVLYNNFKSQDGYEKTLEQFALLNKLKDRVTDCKFSALVGVSVMSATNRAHAMAAKAMYGPGTQSKLLDDSLADDDRVRGLVAAFERALRETIPGITITRNEMTNNYR